LEKKDKRGREKPRREISQRKLKMGCSLSLSLSLSEGCKMAERLEEF
jgi:hypothetical protein